MQHIRQIGKALCVCSQRKTCWQFFMSLQGFILLLPTQCFLSELFPLTPQSIAQFINSLVYKHWIWTKRQTVKEVVQMICCPTIVKILTLTRRTFWPICRNPGMANKNRMTLHCIVLAWTWVKPDHNLQLMSAHSCSCWQQQAYLN